ncbi:MAG: hypothetical protein IJE97_11880 [Thermoguttaceae bacterium]|nr:hypothetical protein [Thermoguttaceae bacterium]
MKLRQNVLVAAVLWGALMACWGGFMIHLAGLFETAIATTALSCWGIGATAAPLVVRFCAARRALGFVGLVGALGLLGAYRSASNVEATALPLYAALLVVGTSIMTAISLINARIVKTCAANETGFVYAFGCACWIAAQASSPISPSCFLVSAGGACVLSLLGFAFSAAPESEKNAASPADDNSPNALSNASPNASPNASTSDARALNVRAFAAFLVVCFLVNCVNTSYFFSVFTPFVQSGFDAAANVLGAAHQGSEFVTVILLGALLAKKPSWTRRLFVVGVALTAARYGLYRVAGETGNEGLLLATSCGHGASYALLTSLVPTLCAASLLKGANARTTARGMSAVAAAAMAAPSIVAPQCARLVAQTTDGWAAFWSVSALVLAVLTVVAALLLPRFETQVQEQAQENADAA